MLRFLDLERELSHLLGVSVDLVQKEAQELRIVQDCLV